MENKTLFWHKEAIAAAIQHNARYRCGPLMKTIKELMNPASLAGSRGAIALPNAIKKPAANPRIDSKSAVLCSVDGARSSFIYDQQINTGALNIIPSWIRVEIIEAAMSTKANTLWLFS